MLWWVRVDVCVEEKIALRVEGNYQVQQLRGGDGERTNSAAIQSVLAFKLLPEYLHFPSISQFTPAAARLPRSQEAWQKHRESEPPATDDDETSKRSRAHHVACLL